MFPFSRYKCVHICQSVGEVLGKPWVKRILTLVPLCLELPFTAVEASCNFEEDLCNFYQDKEGPGWARVKVKPNMYRAGDHTSGLGKPGVIPVGTLGEGEGGDGQGGDTVHAPFSLLIPHLPRLQEEEEEEGSCKEAKTIANLAFDYFLKLEFKLLGYP